MIEMSTSEIFLWLYAPRFDSLGFAFNCPIQWWCELAQQIGNLFTFNLIHWTFHFLLWAKRWVDCSLVLCFGVWPPCHFKCKVCTVGSGTLHVYMINYLNGSFWFQIFACIYVDLRIFILLKENTPQPHSQTFFLNIVCVLLCMLSMKITNIILNLLMHQCSTAMATYRSLSGWCTKSKPFNAYAHMKRGPKYKETLQCVSKSSSQCARSIEMVCINIPISRYIHYSHSAKRNKRLNYEHNSHCKRTLNALYFDCV